MIYIAVDVLDDHTSSVTGPVYVLELRTLSTEVISDQTLQDTGSSSEESVKPTPGAGPSAAVVAAVVPVSLLLFIAGAALFLCYIRK